MKLLWQSIACVAIALAIVCAPNHASAHRSDWIEDYTANGDKPSESSRALTDTAKIHLDAGAFMALGFLQKRSYEPATLHGQLSLSLEKRKHIVSLRGDYIGDFCLFKDNCYDLVSIGMQYGRPVVERKHIRIDVAAGLSYVAGEYPGDFGDVEHCFFGCSITRERIATTFQTVGVPITAKFIWGGPRVPLGIGLASTVVFNSRMIAGATSFILYIGNAFYQQDQ